MSINIKAIIAKHRGLVEAKTHYDSNGRLTSHTIEAHGLKGFKRTPWRKTFKHADHLNDWAEKNDAEVHGTRDLEAANHGNLSTAVHEETLDEVKFAVGDRVFTDEHKHGTVVELGKGDPFLGHSEIYVVKHDGEKHPRVFRHHDLKKSLVKEEVEELNDEETLSEENFADRRTHYQAVQTARKHGMPKPKATQQSTITTGGAAPNNGKLRGPAKGEGIGESTMTEAGMSIYKRIAMENKARRAKERADHEAYVKAQKAHHVAKKMALNVLNKERAELHKNVQHAERHGHQDEWEDHLSHLMGHMKKHGKLPADKGTFYGDTNESLDEAYAAPSTSTNNYAQTLPAGTSKGRVKRHLEKRHMASLADTMTEGAFADAEIKGEDDQHEHAYNTGFEHGHKMVPPRPPKHPELATSYMIGHGHGVKAQTESFRGRHGHSVLENPAVSHQRGLDHGLDGKPPQPPANEHEAASYMLGHKAGTKRRMAILQYDRLHDEVITSMDDLQPIFEAFQSKVSAYHQGAIHGLKGHELPKKHVETMFGPHASHYYAGMEQGKKEHLRRHVERYGKSVPLPQSQPLPEELKVGDDDQEQKKVRGSNTTNGKVNGVRRKYLGKSRGTTATGKPAHVIDTAPIMGNNDRNVNKTTPSGERKRS